ncbi:MAG: hypothetical protein M1823_003526 [Watsoniomyces obsoletus]|nr:MAG: hypothetical protein M1823_003526 [Watsoniomyces obsoletus]
MMPRAPEMMTDVEREIEQLICKLRAQSPLGLAEEFPDVANELPVSPTCAQRPRSFSDPPAGHQRSPSHELLLRAIFDTPECRTESPSALFACRLRRRGATFHRVEDATVEATERRFHRWAYGDDCPSDDDGDSAERFYFLVDDTSSGEGCARPYNDKDSPRPLGRPSLSARRSAESIDESLCSTSSPISFVAGDDAWSVHSSASDSSEPVANGHIEINRSSLASSTSQTSDPPVSNEINVTLTPSEPISDHQADDQDTPTETRAAEKCEARTSTNTGPGKAKTWKWLAVPRVKSVSRRAKLQVARNQRAAAAKARAIGDSFTDRFSKMEVQEIIDCSTLQARSTESLLDDARRSTSESVRTQSSDGSPSALQHARSHISLPSSFNHLPPIPKVSFFQDEDKEALIPHPLSGAAASSTPNLRLSSASEPGPQSRNAVSALSNRTQRTSTSSSSDDLDWTAFQMAISGPTGDYFMAGDATAEEEEEEEEEIVAWYLGFGFESEGQLLVSEDDEEVDGIEHEANLAALQEPPAAIASRMPPTPRDSTVPKLEEAASKPKALAAESDQWQMSCNLNDLGDFLDVYHLGALGGDYLPDLDL